jgi:hypothetical protein
MTWSAVKANAAEAKKQKRAIIERKGFLIGSKIQKGGGAFVKYATFPGKIFLFYACTFLKGFYAQTVFTHGPDGSIFCPRR